MSRYHAPRNYAAFKPPSKRPDIVSARDAPDAKKLPAYWTSSMFQGHEVICGRYEKVEAAREGAEQCALKSGLRHFILKVEVIE